MRSMNLDVGTNPVFRLCLRRRIIVLAHVQLTNLNWKCLRDKEKATYSRVNILPKFRLEADEREGGESLQILSSCVFMHVYTCTHTASHGIDGQGPPPSWTNVLDLGPGLIVYLGSSVEHSYFFRISSMQGILFKTQLILWKRGPRPPHYGLYGLSSRKQKSWIRC